MEVINICRAAILNGNDNQSVNQTGENRIRSNADGNYGEDVVIQITR